MLNQFFASITGRIKASIRAAIMEAALLGAAALFGIIVVVFVVIAAYDALELVVAPHYAALIVAGIFLIVTLVCVVSSGVLSSSPAAPAAPVPEAKPSVKAPAIKGQMEAIASSLQKSGFRREGALLTAAAAVSKDVRPLHIVALSLLGGFVLGRRFERR